MSTPQNARLLQNLKRWLHRDETTLCEPERKEVAKALSMSRALQTAYSMRRELTALWGRSTDSRERLVKQLQDWLPARRGKRHRTAGGVLATLALLQLTGGPGNMSGLK